MTTRTRRFAGALLLTLAIAACGGPANPSGTVGGSGEPAGISGLPSDFTLPNLATTYEGVTLAEGATIVDRASVKAGLKAIDDSEGGAILRFGKDVAAVEALRPGQIVAFESVGIARIDAIQEEGGELVVTTSGATLDEFITDGVLAFDAPIRFDQLPPEAYTTAMAREGYQLASAGELTSGVSAELAAATVDLVYKGKIRDFDVEWKLTPSADKIDFDLKVSRSNVAVDGQGPRDVLPAGHPTRVRGR